MKGIKFERHKEESLISSQFLKNQKNSKTSHFLIFYSNNFLKKFTDLGAYLKATKNLTYKKISSQITPN